MNRIREKQSIGNLTRFFFLFVLSARASNRASERTAKIMSCPNLGHGIYRWCCRSQSDVAGVGDVVETVVAAVVAGLVVEPKKIINANSQPFI